MDKEHLIIAVCVCHGFLFVFVSSSGSCSDHVIADYRGVQGDPSPPKKTKTKAKCINNKQCNLTKENTT